MYNQVDILLNTSLWSFYCGILYCDLLNCYLLIQRDALNRKSAMFALLNENGQKIISESSEAEAQSIQDKLSLINVQWSNAQNENVDQRWRGF